MSSPPISPEPGPSRSLGPNHLTRRARVSVGVALLGGLLAVLATARAARVEPDVSLPVPPAASDNDDVADHEADLTWTIADAPTERIGYRLGRRHTVEVVPLGPTAVEVEVRTARAFLAMRAAAAEVGVELRLESGFRTAEQQRVLYQAWRNRTGNKAARPGRSNHQSGRALDIVTSAPGAYAWLEANAASFGFMRTVKTEPWHWENVDAPIARGAPHRVTGKVKRGKVAGAAVRPTRHASSAKTASHASGQRVALSRR